MTDASPWTEARADDARVEIAAKFAADCRALRHSLVEYFVLECQSRKVNDLASALTAVIFAAEVSAAFVSMDDKDVEVLSNWVKHVFTDAFTTRLELIKALKL